MTPIQHDDHDALNAAFAENVAGWRWQEASNTHVGRDARQTKRLLVEPVNGLALPVPAYTRSADAVLPWLDKGIGAYYGSGYWKAVGNPAGWSVMIDGVPGPIGNSFPHAAVMALLRANGVEVVQ